jgi:hypothetical protein
VWGSVVRAKGSEGTREGGKEGAGAAAMCCGAASTVAMKGRKRRRAHIPHAFACASNRVRRVRGRAGRGGGGGEKEVRVFA